MSLIDVGVASRAITPKTSIRLNGFAADGRKVEAAAVAKELYAKALAFGPDDQVAVLMTVDNCAIPEEAYQNVAQRLSDEAAIPRERLTICYSHSHMSPCLTDAIPGILAGVAAADAGRDRAYQELYGAHRRWSAQTRSSAHAHVVTTDGSTPSFTVSSA